MVLKMQFLDGQESETLQVGPPKCALTGLQGNSDTQVKFGTKALKETEGVLKPQALDGKSKGNSVG